jgi:predicted TIM-barrel fold metal-dependent hydrolase
VSSLVQRAFAWCSFCLVTPLALPATGTQTSYYALEDFAHVPKIDAHMHIHGPADRLMAQVIADNFDVLVINVDYPDFPPLVQQESDALSLRARYPGRVAFVGTFSVQEFQSPDWSAQALRQIEKDASEGAVGIKIWKNIGLTLRDADGRYVMPDDQRFAPLLNYMEQHHLVLLGHQAEPLNCWLPPDKMTVRSDREYFQEHPQYYMYRHPEMPSHASILAARDRMLKAHPNLQFDAVHLASLEWDVGRIAEFLDRFPTARVDLAARTVHLEYQASRDREKVRRFLLRYQDRILYGSDDAYGPDDASAAAVEDIRRGWLDDWRFLTSADAMRSEDFAGAFSGLRLPKKVVDKIYRRNAQRLFPSAWSSRR